MAKKSFGLINRFRNSGFLKNTSWIIGGKIAQSLISLVVSVLVARFLGPSDFGVINYVASFITFGTAFASLGLNNTIVKEIVDHKENQGEVIGTALTMRFVASIISTIVINVIIIVLNLNNREIWIVAVLLTATIMLETYEILGFWFQYKLLSKFTTIASFVGYIAMTIYRVVLLILKKDVKWFAFATTLDSIVMLIIICIMYKKQKGPRLGFKKSLIKELLSKSYNFILSGLMVAIFTQTDKIMIKEFVDVAYVGIYSAAYSISTMWCFVLTAIITSASPIIFEAKKRKNEYMYKLRLKETYAAIIWLSLVAALVMTFLAKYIVWLIYGTQYADAGAVLQILTWCVLVSYLNMAQNVWMICEHKDKYVKYICVVSTFINVGLNAILIPLDFAVGAAWATLITQVFMYIFVPFLIKDLRPNMKISLDALLLKGIVWGKEPAIVLMDDKDYYEVLGELPVQESEMLNENVSDKPCRRKKMNEDESELT